MDRRYRALESEASLAAEHLAIGVTALGKANYAKQAYYSQAFFALSIGFERSAKLALVVDYILKNNGRLPDNKYLRAFGHNIKLLFEQVDQIAECRGFSEEVNKLPRSPIHNDIVTILSDFASNVTRYYNLDVITGNSDTAKKDDPIAIWFARVTKPVLDSRYSKKHVEKDQASAKLKEEYMGKNSFVFYYSETGEIIDSSYKESLHSAITEFAKPYSRMHVMQIMRFLANVLSLLENCGHKSGLKTIPPFSEIFAVFKNVDGYFKKRITWSSSCP